MWRHYLPPSRSFLSWRALHDKLPTTELLRRKGHQLASRCCLCCRGEDSLDHVFTKCPYATAIWFALGSLFDASFELSQGFLHLFKAASGVSFSSQISALWSSAIINGVWVIWRTRNATIFEDVEPNIHSALRMLWRAIKDTNFFRFGKMFNMVDELRILHLLNIKGIPGLAPRIVCVVWQPPPMGWIKVNIDGSAMGTPGAAGSGGIFRNASAFPRGSFAFSMGSTFAYMAELIAAMFAIEVA